MGAVQATAGVHWLTLATSADEQHVDECLGGLGAPERPGGFGHPCHRVHESGARVYCGSRFDEQPIVINAPGEVCEGWADPLLGFGVELEAWVTRCDFACDVEPADLARRRMFEMKRAFRAGRCETNMKRDSFTEERSYGPDSGFTFYFGGKTARLRMRAYDRRGPLRIETQWRPERNVGEVLPESILKHGAAHWWRSTAAACKFPMPWYRELLDAPRQVLPQLPDVAGALDEVLTQFRQQWGAALWAFGLLGMTLEDLQHVPERLRGSQGAKLLSWARAADASGGDGGKLRAEVAKRCRKSK